MRVPNELYEALARSTRLLIAERDSLYACITDSEGNIPEGEGGSDDAEYLRELDEVIDANRLALGYDDKPVERETAANDGAPLDPQALADRGFAKPEGAA